MWIKNLEIGFSIIDFIFCLNSIQKCLEFDQSTVFLFYEDHLSHFAEIAENIVDAIMIKVLR